MDSSDGRIHRAMALAEAGQIDEARAELAALVRADEDNTAAWAALAQLSDTPKDAIYCLKQVLRTQPDNAWARSHLQRLTQQEPSPVQTQAGEEPSQPVNIPQSGKPSRVPTRLVLGAAGVLAIGSLLGGLLLIRGGSPPGLAPRTNEPGQLTGTSFSMASPSIPVSTLQATAGQATPPPAAPGNEPEGTATVQVTVRATPTTPQGAATTPTSSPTPSPTEMQVLTPTDYPTATDPPQPPDVPTDEPSPTPGPCDCYGASLTCKDFDTQAQAQACYDYCLVQTDIDIFNLDSNQNGTACENLP